MCTLLAIKVLLFVYGTHLKELDIHYYLDEISRFYGAKCCGLQYLPVCPGMKCFWYETSWDPHSYSEASFVPGISILRMSRGDNQSTYP